MNGRHQSMRRQGGLPGGCLRKTTTDGAFWQEFDLMDKLLRTKLEFTPQRMIRKKKERKKPNRVQVLVVTWAVLMTVAVVMLLCRSAWPALVWAVNEIAGLVWHT